MATKHLYVSEENLTLWEEAEIIALRDHRSVTWVVHDALRKYLDAIVREEDSRAQA